jgi:hypothetical protein
MVLLHFIFTNVVLMSQLVDFFDGQNWLINKGNRGLFRRAWLYVPDSFHHDLIFHGSQSRRLRLVSTGIL